MTESSSNIIGYWMSEKKSSKLNWTSEFADVCRKHGFSLVKINLDEPLENQGPFSIIVHKLNGVIGKSLEGNKKAQCMIDRLENYLEAHPEVAVIDSLVNVRLLMHRSTSYDVICTSQLHHMDVFTPTFVELTSSSVNVNKEILKTAGVTFPLVCKSSVSFGTSESHKMCIIFNERGLRDVRPPCVAQSFVNHNAVLYKLYVLGSRHHIVTRPSLKNFYPSDEATIFFNSHDVSKPDSRSALSVLDDEDADEVAANAHAHRRRWEGEPSKMAAIVGELRATLGMDLFGVDVVIENTTGRHVIIDINAFPGYDGYPHMQENMMRCLVEARDSHRARRARESEGQVSEVERERERVASDYREQHLLRANLLTKRVQHCFCSNNNNNNNNNISKTKMAAADMDSNQERDRNSDAAGVQHSAINKALERQL